MILCLHQALGRNTSVKRFGLRAGTLDDSKMQLLWDSLENNRGIKELVLSSEYGFECVSDERWAHMLRSIGNNTTLEVLDLQIRFHRIDGETQDVAEGRKQARTIKMLEMIKRNSVLHTIIVDQADVVQTILQQVQQYFEVNKHRSRVHALKTDTDAHLRPRFLRGAMYNVRDKQPALMYMLAKENVDLVMEYEKRQRDARRKRKSPTSMDPSA